ncbi:uncharacterized protein LOC111357608 [Spodoptera litura]|uniref:Odorant binding protein 13 n=1 Tax=Spodoptera litura TaxID=69820 RepID=A0A0M4K0E3_SPOLT
MITSCLLVLSAVVQVLLAKQPVFESGPPEPWGPPERTSHPGQFQPRVPKRCWVPPQRINVYNCCPIPTLYPDEDMQSCGFEKLSENKPQKPVYRPEGTCKEGYCVMGKFDLLLANNSVDYVKFREYLDNWAESYPEFANAIHIAKEECAQDGGPEVPPICEPDKLFLCLTSTIFWNCKLRDGEGCAALQEHMNECKQYYTRVMAPTIKDFEVR